MKNFKKNFISSFDIKNIPNNHEKQLINKTIKYVDKIKNIPGISMIAIVNSLSMFATNKNSDIDLFIITKPKMLWFVRFFITIKFWRLGVWRRKNNIASNFCLSFFVTEKGMNLQKIAIQNDIYLYFWIYFLKPIIIFDNCYENFLEKNNWVEMDENQKQKNLEFCKNLGKSKKIYFYHYFFSKIIEFFGKIKTQKNYEKLGKPLGIIIDENMLKFHNYDQRKNYRDLILKGEKIKKDFIG